MTKTKFVAKKSLGQHFLRSEKALKQIVDSIDTRFDKKNWLFEIGPGEGVLTAKLLDAGYKVCVVEVDKRSIEILHEDFRNQISSGQMKVLNKDCLEVDYSAELEKWGRGEAAPPEYSLVGNIPYYITGAIFRHTFEQKFLPQQAIFLVQKEVAQRVVANNKKESLLSVSVKIFGEANIVDFVKAGSFIPPPKVDSAILSIKNIYNPFLPAPGARVSMDLFFTILKAAFSQKRKYLISNLKNKLDENLYQKYENVFQEIFVKKYGEKVRAEDLKIEDWKNILVRI